mgnify:CR=1 FL=1
MNEWFFEDYLDYTYGQEIEKFDIDQGKETTLNCEGGVGQIEITKVGLKQTAS